MSNHSAWMREAASTCATPGCEARVLRTEQAWHQDEDGRWRLRAKSVCSGGHRVLVEPF